MSLVRPESVIGEILGEPAARMRNPVGAGYQCPYIGGECTKRSHLTDGPYPVCSVWYPRSNPRPMATCPKRFFQPDDLVADVIRYCWPGKPPEHPRVAYEIHMDKFGNVDMAIADFDVITGRVREFVSVELQAVDLSGSVANAYRGILFNSAEVNVTYGVSWANVRKRLVAQLVSKGLYHTRWNTRMAAVVQTPLYDYLREHIEFVELDPHADSAELVFLLYDFVESSSVDEPHTLVFDRAVGTTHSSLMMSTLYQEELDKSEFAKRIAAQL